jgi:hypothetical protein
MTQKLAVFKGSVLDNMNNLPKTIRCFITNPPYWKCSWYGTSAMVKECVPGVYLLGCEPNVESYIINLAYIFERLYRRFPTATFCVVLGESKTPSRRESLSLVPERFILAMSRIGLKLTNSVVWRKTAGQTKWNFPLDYERVLVFQDISFHHIFNPAHVFSSVWEYRRPSLKGSLFYSLPPQIYSNLINSFSRVDDVVCDPFMGIGQVGVEALRLQRKFVGVELLPQSFAKAKKSLSKML